MRLSAHNKEYGSRRTDLQILSRRVRELVLAEGRRLREIEPGDRRVVVEEGRDIKLIADLESDAYISPRLKAILDVPILSEEQEGRMEVLHEGMCWILDPLDGSLNFKRDFPVSSISIALWDGQTPILGTIYDFNSDNLYEAYSESGAWWNDKQIRVSETPSLDKAIIATGIPSEARTDDRALASTVELFRTAKKVRMIGSAALSLAMVAKGVFDGYHESGIKIWDVAAGVCLVNNAGGVCALGEIGENYSVDLRAHNGKLWKK